MHGRLALAMLAIISWNGAEADDKTEKMQFIACQKECMTEGAKCEKDSPSPLFCTKRVKQCIAYCGECMAVFTQCTSASSVSACQEPFAACLEDKLSAGVAQ